jgi:hypothetical protein
MQEKHQKMIVDLLYCYKCLKFACEWNIVLFPTTFQWNGFMTNTKIDVFNAYLLNINLELEWTNIEKLVKNIVKDAQQSVYWFYDA